jgi:transcription elongation factor GreA
MSKVPMTVRGAEWLKEELHRLKAVERPRVSNAIAEARALGDLKENAEYHAAREEQGFIQGRIQEIESKLSNAYIIDIKTLPQDGRVVFGVVVELVNVKTDEKVRYHIVGDDESDLKNKKISINSPIARALIGKSEGDTVGVQTPSGLVEYDIDKVRYDEVV